MRRNGPPLEHVAGPEGLKQVCTRCGFALQDFEGKGFASSDGKPPGHWREGDRVVVYGAGRFTGATLRQYWNGPVRLCAEASPA